MAARSDAWFRRVGTVSLTTSGGSQVQGFGAVLPWREERADLWGERPHAPGMGHPQGHGVILPGEVLKAHSHQPHGHAPFQKDTG